MSLEVWLKKCIEGCKSSGEINTQNKAEVLLEKLTKELDPKFYALSEEMADLKESGGATPEQIESAVNSYLEEHPVQSTPVDKTLKNANEAADAEIVGQLFFGYNYVIENGGSGGKQFAVNLFPEMEYVYTNNSSAGQNLVITYDDDSTKTITGNLSAGASVTFTPEKNVKSIGGWYNASAAFVLANIGAVGDVIKLQDRASAMDERVDGLQHIVDDVNNRFTSVLDKVVMFGEIGYLTADGIIYASSSASNTGKVVTEGYSKVSLTAYCPAGIYALGFYDSDGALLTDDSVMGSGTYQTYDVVIPDTAAYVLASNLNSFDAPTCRLYNAESFEQRINAEKCNNVFAHSAFAAFAKFCVIGDSLSVGYTGNPITGQHVNRNIPYSWPQFMARMLGNSALNFGFSGLTTKTWMSSAYGKDRLIVPENMCQAYIIGLGVNDTASLSVGSVDDIDFDDMSNNADTFCGWYAKIIKLINDTAEHAKIFMLTDPLILPVNRAYNEAVRVLAANEHFNNVYLVDLAADKYKPLFESVYVSGARSAGHYSAVGYSNIASAIAYCLSDVMMQTPDDFISIPFIPYGDAEMLN